MQNVIQMAFRWQFLAKNHRNFPAAGGFALRPPFVMRSICTSFSAPYKNEIFFEQKILVLVKPPFNKILVARPVGAQVLSF